MASAHSAFVYTLKVSLQGIKPPIWRKVRVQGDIRLNELHQVIQNLMGWSNSHMHQYAVGNVLFGEPDPEFRAELKDEQKFTLADIAPQTGAKFRYDYDFGDNWMHEVKVEKIEPKPVDFQHPICIGGARNCPPEDIGGIWGYSDMINAMADENDERHEEFLELFDGPFEAELFDLEETNYILKNWKFS